MLVLPFFRKPGALMLMLVLPFFSSTDVVGGRWSCRLRFVNVLVRP